MCLLNHILFFAAVIYFLAALEVLVNGNGSDGSKAEKSDMGERQLWKSLQLFFSCY